MSGPESVSYSHMSGTLAGIISNLFIRSLLQGSWTSSCQPGTPRMSVPREDIRAASSADLGLEAGTGSLSGQSRQSPPKLNGGKHTPPFSEEECDKGSAVIFNLLY